jgi:hypothetical protein
MDDKKMEELIETISLVFADFMDDGESPTLIASVMFAVAIKQLRLNLDDEDFYAILDEIKNTEMLTDEWEQAIQDTKRIVH